MPHISKQVLTRKSKEGLARHLTSFLARTNRRARRVIFQELFTKTERIMAAKRLTLIGLIERGVPNRAIARTLTVSTSTVRRFEKEIWRGGFSHTRTWLRKEPRWERVFKLLIEFAAIPFEAQHKSLGQILDQRWERETRHHRRRA